MPVLGSGTDKIGNPFCVNPKICDGDTGALWSGVTLLLGIEAESGTKFGTGGGVVFKGAGF